MMRAKILVATLLAFMWAVWLLPACDSGGVPVRMRLDEFTLDLDVDELMTQAHGELSGLGVVPPGSSLPELWPDSLPAIQYRLALSAPPTQVDLSPEEGSDDYEKYKDISRAAGVVKRIELNRLVVRIEASSLTVALPELALQVADDKEADPTDRLAWRTVGSLPGAPAGFVGDLEFEFIPGGESYLRAQLADDAKEFAARVVGRIDIDTAQDPRLPSGRAVIRLIAVATFFIDPSKAI